MLVEVETNHEWHQRHSKEGKPIDINNGLLIYPTGASCRSGDMLRGGQRSEPPDDPVKCLEMQRDYAVEKVRQLRQDFNKKKRELSNLAQTAARQPLDCMVGEYAVKQLQALKNVYLEWADRLAEIEKQLADTPENRAAAKEKAERETLSRQLSHRYQSIHQDIENVTLESGPPMTTLESHPVSPVPRPM